MWWNNSLPPSPPFGDPVTFHLKRKSDLTPCRTFVLFNNWPLFEKKVFNQWQSSVYLKHQWIGELVFVFKIFTCREGCDG